MLQGGVDDESLVGILSVGLDTGGLRSHIRLVLLDMPVQRHSISRPQDLVHEDVVEHLVREVVVRDAVVVNVPLIRRAPFTRPLCRCRTKSICSTN